MTTLKEDRQKLETMGDVVRELQHAATKMQYEVRLYLVTGRKAPPVLEMLANEATQKAETQHNIWKKAYEAYQLRRHFENKIILN